MRTIKMIAGAMAATASLYIPSALSAPPVVYSGSGADATTALDAFRAAIGGAKNTAGPEASGRREISWDGVKLDGTDANPNTQVVDSGHTVVIPVDRFRAQGALFEDPYAVSGDGFASVNPGTAGQFPAFSPNNTFVMQDQTPYQFDDRFIGQSFTIPGTATAAGTRGFGAIFIDVEKAGSSSIEYFGHDAGGHEVSLGTFAVPTGASGEPQFLGVLFDNPVVTDVNLTVGTNTLFNFDGTSFQSFGPENLSGNTDLAVTDDFVFAEPTMAAAVPEPSSYALMLAGLCLIGFAARHKTRLNLV
ncbi:PEP-CTERM protein-sorting domain-containing protein [Nitrosospira sp. Nsp18]|uniref:PEP-CTERM sorting domain-containing protein n=1 Tax=Nitrosospira sp. Nsp18 TaxID=1855334 RepID=UPI00088F381E|nr:PEP-CTERM sorting domain-containing protein [Nitrosospira sp. Nsp18]SDA23247.1 PEP-CTERM protein-sorting domain-containing protein [Nitrosospira sp. Nsp18]